MALVITCAGLAGCGARPRAGASPSPPAPPTVATAATATPNRPSPATPLPATVAQPAAAGPTPPAPAAGSVVMVAAVDNRFEPPYLEIRTGTTVRWRNGGKEDHDVVSDDSSVVSPVMKAGETYEHTFATPGAFPYACDLHDGMTATIVVQ